MKYFDYYTYSLYRPEQKVEQKSEYTYKAAQDNNRPWHIIEESKRDLRPFEDSSALSERIFPGQSYGSSADPLNLPAERARTHYDQLGVMFRQLESRHAISYEIKNTIQYEESTIRSKLEEMQDWPPFTGPGGSVEADLENRLLMLRKERWAEEIACWRDTNRLLSGIFENWSGYAEQKRKQRWMDFDV